MAGQVRVVVVDDSRLMRRMIAAALQAEGTIEVVGEAADVREARERIRTLNPDVITLDVEMPGMNGIAFLQKIMELRPMPVIMVSTLTAQGTDATLAALQIGAVDAIQKPDGRAAQAPFARRLRALVLGASRARVRPAAPPAAPRTPAPPAPRARRGPVEVIAIGASTGGVSALTEVLSALPARTPPIVITQHMPVGFTARFAQRLDNLLPHRVAEASAPEPLSPGQIRIAPGDRHLCLERRGGRLYTRLDTGAPVCGHRPSVDALFRSVAEAAGSGALGVLLTGMGRDGAEGLRMLRAAGGGTIGQNEESCVVYGMPQAARILGAVEEELHLARIGPRIGEILNPPGLRDTA